MTFVFKLVLIKFMFVLFCWIFELTFLGQEVALYVSLSACTSLPPYVYDLFNLKGGSNPILHWVFANAFQIIHSFSMEELELQNLQRNH